MTTKNYIICLLYGLLAISCEVYIAVKLVQIHAMIGAASVFVFIFLSLGVLVSIVRSLKDDILKRSANGDLEPTIPLRPPQPTNNDPNPPGFWLTHRNVAYCVCGHSVSMHGNEYLGNLAGQDCQSFDWEGPGRCKCTKWRYAETRTEETN